MKMSTLRPRLESNPCSVSCSSIWVTFVAKPQKSELRIQMIRPFAPDTP